VNLQVLKICLAMQGGAVPTVRTGRPVLPVQAQMQLELCRQLQEGHCPVVASQRISWLQVHSRHCTAPEIPSFAHQAAIQAFSSIRTH